MEQEGFYEQDRATLYLFRSCVTRWGTLAPDTKPTWGGHLSSVVAPTVGPLGTSLMLLQTAAASPWDSVWRAGVGVGLIRGRGNLLFSLPQRLEQSRDRASGFGSFEP